MNRFFVFYRLNGKTVINSFESLEDADACALATRGNSWIFDKEKGWWYQTSYNIKRQITQFTYDYVNCSRTRQHKYIPEDFKLSALLLGG